MFSSRAENQAEDGKQLVKELFARLEFQDGKRRRHVGPSQSYHGSGRAHLHMLLWLETPEKVAWANILRADLPDKKEEPELRSLVEGSQLDWEKSGWPRREEETKFADGQLSLHHPEKAHAAHVRAWMPDVLGAMQCHMDVQAGDGRGLLLQYTAGYTSKFSDQFATSWLNEEATDYHLARKILAEKLGTCFYHKFSFRGVIQRFLHVAPHTFMSPPLDVSTSHVPYEHRRMSWCT